MRGTDEWRDMEEWTRLQDDGCPNCEAHGYWDWQWEHGYLTFNTRVITVPTRCSDFKVI